MKEYNYTSVSDSMALRFVVLKNKGTKFNTNNMPTPDLVAEKCVGKNL